MGNNTPAAKSKGLGSRDFNTILAAINGNRPVRQGHVTTRGFSRTLSYPKRRTRFGESSAAFGLFIHGTTATISSGILRLQGIADYDVAKQDVALAGAPKIWLALAHKKDHSSTTYVCVTTRPSANDGTFWYWLFAEMDAIGAGYKMSPGGRHHTGGDIVMGAAI